MKSFLLIKNPAFPFKSISLGPVGELVEIIGLLRAIASINTLGKPSKLDDKINKSDFLI